MENNTPPQKRGARAPQRNNSSQQPFGWPDNVSVPRKASCTSSDQRVLRLSRLIPLWPSELETPDEAAAHRVIALLQRALRGERRRGRAGHWSYDLARHMALVRALRMEQARLARLRNGRRGTNDDVSQGG